MAVKIRLSRLGRKNRPFWRVVAIDARKKRDGAFLDNLGSYDPLNHKVVTLNVEGIAKWVSQGAECSPAVTKIVKLYKRTGEAVTK